MFNIKITWKYAKETPFYEELHAELDNYTDEERTEDRAKLDHMLEKEDSTVVDPNNWAHVKAKGERIKLWLSAKIVHKLSKISKQPLKR